MTCCANSNNTNTYKPNYVKGAADGNWMDSISILKGGAKDFQTCYKNAKDYIKKRMPNHIAISNVEKVILNHVLTAIIYDENLFLNSGKNQRDALIQFEKMSDAQIDCLVNKIATYRLLKVEEVLIALSQNKKFLNSKDNLTKLLIKSFNKTKPYAEQNYLSILRELKKDKEHYMEFNSKGELKQYAKESSAASIFKKLMGRKKI